jgi:hypothetical protein
MLETSPCSNVKLSFGYELQDRSFHREEGHEGGGLGQSRTNKKIDSFPQSLVIGEKAEPEAIRKFDIHKREIHCISQVAASSRFSLST